MKKISFIFLLLVFCFPLIFSFNNVLEYENNSYINISEKGDIKGILEYGKNQIMFSNNNSEIHKKCIYSEDFFENKDNCISNCTLKNYECVLKEDYCYYCIDQSPKSLMSLLWGKLKSWLNIGGKNKKANVQNKGGDNDNEKKEEFEKLKKQTFEKLILESGKLDNPEEIHNNLEKMIENAESLNEIIELNNAINEYCFKTGDVYNDYENEQCKELRKKIKKKADKFKDEEFDKIDPNDPKALNKMMQLRALLMAFEKASGGSELFSEENVKKVRRGLKKKAKKWWNKHIINEDKTIEELWEDWALASAFTKATWEGEGIYYGNENDSSLFGGKMTELKQDINKKANKVVAKKLLEIDVCNPDKEKLERLKQQLKQKNSKGEIINENGCEILLNSKKACEALEKGNLQEAYKECYENSNLDENEKSKLPEPPIDCNGEDSKNTSNKNKEDEEEEGYYEETPTNITEELRINFYEEDVLGFDFEIENSEREHDEVLYCFLECGYEPPLVYADEFPETEEMCYETLGGFVDEETLVPCYPREMPPEEISNCIAICAENPDNF